VFISSTVSGGILDSKKFYSSSDYQCPATRAFGSSVEHINAGSVDSQDIVDWLKTFFK
jgi:hypothetical protein